MNHLDDRVMRVDERSRAGVVLGIVTNTHNQDVLARVRWDDGTISQEYPDDLMPADPKPEDPVNHPINPTAHQLTDLWLDSLADVPEVAPQYFANLNAARLAAALGHLASVALLLIVRSIVTPLRKGWKAGTR